MGSYAVACARPKATLSSTQLTIEKLISKGRVLTMANQVLAVNISEEVSSTNHVWDETTSGGAGDDWPGVWPFCSEPHGAQALGGHVGGGHRSNPSPGAQQTGRAPKTCRVGTRGRGALHVAQGWEAGVVLPEWAALPGEGRGDGL